MPIYQRIVIALITAAAVSPGAPAWARSIIYEPPTSYKLISKDRMHVFVMLAPGDEERELAWFKSLNHQENHLKRIQDIRTTYPESGLYPNDGSTTPLWRAPFSYAAQSNIWLSSDGVYLIRLQHSTSAVSFYESGVLIGDYSYADLIDFPFLIQVKPFKRIAMNDDEFTLTLVTGDGNTLVFDVSTGQVISADHFVRRLLCILVAVLNVLLLGYVGFTCTRRRGLATPPATA